MILKKIAAVRLQRKVIEINHTVKPKMRKSVTKIRSQGRSTIKSVINLTHCGPIIFSRRWKFGDFV